MKTIKIKLTFFFVAIYLNNKRKALIKRVIMLQLALNDLKKHSESDLNYFREHSDGVIKSWVDNYCKLAAELEKERDYNKNSRKRRRNALKRGEHFYSKRMNRSIQLLKLNSSWKPNYKKQKL